MSEEGLFQRLARQLSEDDSAFTMADVLDLPATERAVLRRVMRRADPPAVAELTAQLRDELGLSMSDIDSAIKGLVEREAIVVHDGHVRVASIATTRRTTPGGIWDRLSGL